MDKIEKKIKHLLWNLRPYLNQSSVKKFLTKDLPSINYKVDGNNVLHLVGKYSYDTSWVFVELIQSLIELGIDVNETNNEGKNYLHLIFENTSSKPSTGWSFDNLIKYIEFGYIPENLDLNQRDNDGRTIIHSLLNCNMKYDDLYSIKTICNQLFYKGFNQVEGFGNEEKSIFELMDEKQLKLSDEKNRQNSMISNDLKTKYYTAHPLETVKLFNGDDSHDKEIFISIFDNTTTGLIEVFYNCSKNIENEDETLSIFKRYIEILNNNPYTTEDYIDFIIHGAIANVCEVDFIIKLIELGLEYNFDFNNCDFIVKMQSSDAYNFAEAEKIYDFISKKGYKPRVSGNVLREDAIKQILINLLDENNLYTDHISISFTHNIIEIIDDFCSAINNISDYDFITKIIEEIVNERNNDINSTNKDVTELEIAKKIKEFILKSTEKKLIKKLDLKLNITNN